LKVSTVRQDLTSDGSEFQVCGAATEKDRRGNSVRVFGTISSGASDDSRGRTGTAVWIRSFKYAGVEEIFCFRASMRASVNTTSYKVLVGISPNLQFNCSLKQR